MTVLNFGFVVFTSGLCNTQVTVGKGKTKSGSQIYFFLAVIHNKSESAETGEQRLLLFIYKPGEFRTQGTMGS